MNRRKLLGWLGLGSAGALTATGLATSKAQAGNRYYSGPKSDHFDGRVFFNPNGSAPRSFTDLLRWQFGEKRIKWPDEWPSPFPSAKPDKRVEGVGLRLTMVGHATLLIQTAGLNMLTDPVWSDRCSPISFAGPSRVNPPGITFDDLPPIDIVLLSHNHYDHMDIDTLERLHKVHAPKIVTPLGNDTILKAAIPGLNVSAHDWGQTAELDGVKIHLEPAHHWSARGLGDRRMALWAAFVIDTLAGKIYHVGDTGFHAGENYRAAGGKYGSFRLAILPVGAYEPRWFMEAQHQNPKEAVEGMKLCNAAFAAGHHWATFHLTNEAIDEPLALLQDALEGHGIGKERFRPMLPGEIWDVPRQG